MSPAAAPVTAPRRAARPQAPVQRPTARPRTPLAVVTPPRPRMRRGPFVVLSLVVVGVGLLGLLGLNTVLAEDAFRRHDLERQAALLAEREQALQRDVAALEAPARLAAEAAAIGLVPAGPPAFLRLSDGAVLGTAMVATTPPAPVASPVPTPAADAARPAPSATPVTP